MNKDNNKNIKNENKTKELSSPWKETKEWSDVIHTIMTQGSK